jgi:membrane protein implicated in regulation of membrane protease activity
MTIAVFLAWFGGAGYLLTHAHMGVVAGLTAASLSGLTGAGIVFLFVAKFLMARDFTLNPDDFDMVGVLGTVSGVIHEKGIGEILFEQQGTRRACAARHEEGSLIEKGEEVVVTRYEDGVAYVRRWEDLAGGAGILQEERKQSQ